MKIIFTIWMLLRRILNQWRLELCLFLGLLVAMSVAIAVPLYTNGALQESFLNEMKTTYNERPPFTYTASITEDASANEKPLTRKRIWAAYQYLQKNPIPKRMGIPLICSGWSGMTADQLEVPDPGGGESPITAFVFTMTSLESLVTFDEGRAPAAQPGPDGVMEMVCGVETADKMGLIVGNTYRMRSTILEGEKSPSDNQDTEPKIDLAFKLVGTFSIRNDRINDPGWLITPNLSSSVFVNPKVFMDYLIRKQGVAVTGLDSTWIMDYRKVRVQDLPRLINICNDLGKEFTRFDPAIQVNTSPFDVLEKFSEERQTLQLMILILALPTLFIVIYYILLMAGLIVDGRRGEIAMLRSRGAGAVQLTGMFVMEWTILAVCCLLAGPPFGLFLAQMVGSSAGFLNFVDRKALPIAMTGEAYLYSAILAVIMITAATVPAALACRNTIITHKQNRSRGSSKPIWQRFYLDFVLLGIGIYGYRLMSMQAQAVDKSSDVSNQLVDPLLFLIPVLLIIAGGLLVIRFLPWITGLAAQLIGRRKGVALYASLVEISRNMASFRPLILLIILTTAAGIYSSALARTLDKNTHDRIYYAAGADVILNEQWFRIIMQNGQFVPDKSRPYEPPFSFHRQLPGVLSAAKVQMSEVSISSNTYWCNAKVMAIDPCDFGHTAWFRRGLTPLPVATYLNLLTKYPQAAIVSRSLIKSGAVKLGDPIILRMNGGIIYLVIAGAVDYWPTLYTDQGMPFIIANLDYITQQSSIRPYNIWLRLKPGAKIAPIMKGIAAQGVGASIEKDIRHELVEAHRDPRKMGLYGIMSIGFCIAVLVTVIGYILYTLISLQKRMLQFGVLRAIGLSLKQLISILVLEQLWTAGTGLIIGTIIGQTISWVFVPFLRTATAMIGDTPPFQVIISGSDIAIIYSILLPVLIMALAGLALSLNRLQVHQAVKLGEES